MLGMAACKNKGNTSNALGGPPLGNGPVGGPKNPNTGGKIIPPTPVIGSFLVELRREDAEPMANAKVGMLGKGEEEAPPAALTSLSFWLGTGSAQIIYETKADEFGLVALPINKISSNQLDLKIEDAGRVFLSRFILPSDFANAVSQLRVNGGLPPLPNYPAEPQTAGTTAASSEALLSEQKVALQLPEDSATTASSGETPVITEPQVFSLPVSTGTAEKTFDIYPEVANVSGGTSARFTWQNSFTSAADIRIAYSYSEASLSAWDGKLASVPDLSTSREGINFVTDYSGCTDTGFRTQVFGTLQAVNDGRCGFVRSEFPFNDGSDVFVRVAGESDTAIKLSRVFRIGFSEVTLSSATVAENAPLGTDVGTLAISNSGGASFSYQLSGTDASAFTIVADKIKTNRVFDFEAQRNFAITITSARSDGDSLSKNFIIKVADVNESPTNIALSNMTVLENMPVGTAVGTFSVADPDVSDTFTYGIISDFFEINNGKLMTKAPLDYEQKGTYSIDVMVTDQGGLKTFKSFTIAVLDVKEAPSDIILSGNTILENNAIGTEIGTLISIDSDEGSTHSYTLAGTDSYAFEVVGAKLRAKIIFNYELKSAYSFFVTTTDQDNLSFAKPLTISVGNLIEAPADIVLSKTSVAENLESGALVGVLSLLQPNMGSTYAYTLGGADGTSFDVVGNNFVTKSVFDFETKSSYAVTITATDQNNVGYTKTFTLTVANVSEPISDIVLSSSTINENVSIGSTVATLTGINQDVGANITYSLSGADAASFAMSGANTLVVTAPINFESKSSYALTITGRDQNNLSFGKTFTLTVVDQNEAPTDISLSSSTVSELAVTGTTIGTLATIDPDASNTFMYSLSGPDAGLFSISGNLLKTGGGFNFEDKSSYSISVTSTDQGSQSFTKSLTIQITDSNEAPTDVILSNSTVVENANLVGLLSALDPDAGNTFTYSLGGTDASAFSISGGMLVALAPLDFEAQDSYAVTIVVKDQNDLQISKNFSIQVTNVNEAPTNLTLSANTLSENALVGSVVGVFTPTDPDFGESFTYTLAGPDAGSFSIVSGNLVSTSPVNFEAKSSYTIAVTVKDQGDLSFTKNFTVTVLNVNEAPTNMTLSSTSIDENLGIGTVVGLISSSDPDFGNAHTYMLSGTDASSFTIAGSSLKSSLSFNYELKNSYSFTIKSTDQGGLFISKNFTVTVNNVDEPSTDILLSSSNIGQNLPIGTTVGTLSTLDPDTGSQFTYTLSGTDASSFSLVGDALKTAEIFNAATKSSYMITVTSTVQSGLFISKNFTISVSGGAVAPTDILLSRNTVWENGGVNAVVGTLGAVDADTLPANMIFSLVAGAGDTDNAKFNISGNSLRATASLDYEVQDIYSLRVRAADPEGGAFERIFAVQAVDVFEDPYFDNVVLLAHLEGSPGNTTFVDSSKLKKTLTQVSTGGHDFSNSKFGVTSLRSSASGYVDAGIVNFPDGTDFTMEGWWYRTLDNVNGIKGLFITESAANTQCRIAVQEGTGTLSLVTSSSGFYYTSFIINSSSAAQLSVPLNTWHHVAYTRNGSMLRIFLNGVLVKSVSGSDCFSNNGYLRFARNVSGGDAGYFDEFRVTMGVARYTADFVAPTTPFPDENPPTFIPSVLGTTYTQSSVNASSTAAQSSFLTDGTILGNVAATNAEASSGWIKVDFKRPYLIDRVIVGTSNASAASPLADKSLTENKTVEYSIDGTNWSFAFNTGTLPALGIYKFDVDFHARYLRIKNTSASSDILSVSEFYALSPGQNYTAGSFTPIKAYPVVWYDSSDAASISLDNATSAAPAVLGWADKAYWKRHLSQASASNRPSITRNFVNGRNTLVWPSTDNDKFLENSSSVTVSEVYAVGRFAGPSTTNFSNTESILAPRNNSLSSWLTAVGSSTQFNPTIFNQMFLNAVNSLNRIDNVFPEMSNLSLIRATTEFASATSTNGITVGIDRLQTALGRGWKGEISELILYSPPLSTTDRASVESYLKTKWNLP
jgi:hypothetical protein